VAVLAPNLPATFEAHFGVPLAGAVLNALNIRLDPETIAFILRHGEAKVLIADSVAPVVGAASERLARKPLVIDICDPAGLGGARQGAIDYEAFLASGDPNFAEIVPQDEWDAIALNYT
jgi:fatty-acyl-CoA synthase